MLYHFGFFAFHTFIFVGIFYVSSVFGLYVFVQVSLRLSLLLRRRLRSALSGITGYYPSHAAWRRAVPAPTAQGAHGLRWPGGGHGNCLKDLAATEAS